MYGIYDVENCVHSNSVPIIFRMTSYELVIILSSDYISRPLAALLAHKLQIYLRNSCHIYV